MASGQSTNTLEQILIISESPKFICFQPWKCGSTTLFRRLRKYDNAQYPQSVYFNETLGKLSHKHIALEDFFELPESRQNCLRFTFVRNPYDRLYSGFIQRRHRMTNNPPQHMPPEDIEAELRSIEGGFDDFLEFFLEPARHAVSGPTSLHQHVYHDDKPAVDFVGFLETFEASFAQICDSIGILDTNNRNGNIRHPDGVLETASSFSAARYRYIDKYHRRSIEAVNTCFENDFQCLGYRMLDLDHFSESGALIDPDISPFSDAIMTERQGQILTFDRHND
jgi:hypothetical protein